MNKKLILPTIVIILALGFIIFYVKKPAMAPTTEVQPVTNTSPLANQSADQTEKPAEGAISISPQKAGSSIVVDEITLSKPGFVVIHEDNAGSPGKIIGQTFLLTAGTKQDIVVKVSVQAGKTYYAMLHSDNGDTKFNATDDVPLKDSKGMPIMTMFTVTK